MWWLKEKLNLLVFMRSLDYHNDKTFPNLMDVVNHFNEGRKKYKSGDFKNAINSFNECLKGK